MSATLLGKECRFALHIPKNAYNDEDYHLVKEQLHYSDGRIEPNIRLIKDFKRPFWITKKAFQNHKNKKEWESVDKLIEYKTTESDLAANLAKALHKPMSNSSAYKLMQSPFVYGANISSTSLIKYGYLNKYKNVKSRYSVAMLDIETDMHGDLGILMITVVFNNKLLTVINKKFVEGIASPLERIDELTHFYLKEYVEKYKFETITLLADDEVGCIRQTFELLHQWKPDLLSIWNINYDLTVILNVLERNGIRPESILSDPSIPDNLRVFHVKKGREKRVTASGVLKPFPPHEQWHTVYNTASFYMVDAMCVYYHNRLGAPQEPSYALDAILTKELGLHKLKIKEVEHLDSIAFHLEMQQRYKLEYAVYNRFDCIGMLELEEKTMDVSMTMPMYAQYSDFSNYDSQPARAVVSVFYYLKDKGYILAATGGSIREDLDEETLDRSGWIAFLKPHLLMDNGLCCIEESSLLKTLVLKFVADLDVSAAYPSGQIVFNISKETTKKEILDIKGIEESIFRRQNINVLSGHVNAIEYCCAMFGFPAMDDLLTLIE